MLDFVLDPILGPLLDLPILWSIVIISFLIALFMTLVYKWMTDQHLMKTLKDEIKKHQNAMKEHKHDTQKVMEIQKKAMEVNMNYMKQSMKPTLITFIPIILIFGWLNANLAFMPIMPGEEFRIAAIMDDVVGDIELMETEGIILINENVQEIIDNRAVWRLKAEPGDYLLTFKYNEKEYEKELIVTEQQKYATLSEKYDNNVKEIKINNEPMKVLNLFGWKIGWLGTYIIFSIIFSMSMRKALKLH